MKLFICISCHDVVKMDYELRYCKCRESSGKYLSDGDCAELYGKNAVALGILNSTLVKALRHIDSENPESRNFTAFVFDKNYYKIKKYD